MSRRVDFTGRNTFNAQAKDDSTIEYQDFVFYTPEPLNLENRGNVRIKGCTFTWCLPEDEIVKFKTAALMDFGKLSFNVEICNCTFTVRRM